MTLELSMALGGRDVTEALLDGTVEPDGIDLNTVSLHPSNRHRRFFSHGRFDVCEVGMASYVSSRADTEAYPFTAIPVFTNKRFRHAYFYKHTDAGIEEPADLEGKTVGISSWQTAANVWTRGIMQEHYDLDLTDVEWYRRKQDDVPIEVPERYDVRDLPGKHGGDAVAEREDLIDALVAGDLDAVMDPAGATMRAVDAAETTDFVFEDPIAEEQQYFRETGIFPPNHVVVIRDEVLEEHPWVALNIYHAFCEARDHCFERNRSPSTNAAITWAPLYLLEQQNVLGEAAWDYGLTEANRKAVETFLQYSHEQGLIDERYDVEALFDESTIARPDPA
ncbi:4,5-dihydroxyphthalate decarboxylase [Halorhabdus utahensis DSM 12940]|uniref:4,5-dihydroxyphthalate decarboxylase n=1 Tax=Halorhabdus utahensis (strain DSM 12940 / JCM 11049 / AX-2) TaxID=519442 RepID=C7NN11_HALUD|nr:ABC transporter substrate-binding protein [Halorhabdus utahensis]ACV11411.1 4,5-dihydroxyphthalate decarboxylase [Halorhabdus utahensis DSM 12940]